MKTCGIGTKSIRAEKQIIDESICYCDTANSLLSYIYIYTVHRISGVATLGPTRAQVRAKLVCTLAGKLLDLRLEYLFNIDREFEGQTSYFLWVGRWGEELQTLLSHWAH